ncbi:hypothetical protein LEP1GSC172_2409 [Leptospira noguchii]|uniref:Uncharacterized protein n=1 Tax=Leptospira noguchii TaxID=28182 RepID=M6VJ13_9LEPT|nr:hypothetical protein LEP1GSC172_2409 [Leptospira noguchii]
MVIDSKNSNERFKPIKNKCINSSGIFFQIQSISEKLGKIF